MSYLLYLFGGLLTVLGLAGAGLGLFFLCGSIGMDGLFLSALMSPALTTVRLPVPAMARTIVERVIGRMADPAIAPGEFLFAPELELRDSVAAPAKVRR